MIAILIKYLLPMFSADRTLQIADWLSRHQSLWQARPFYESEPRWAAQYPHLYNTLLTASDADIQHARVNPDFHLQWLSQYLPSLGELIPLLHLPPAADYGHGSGSPHFPVGIPGRKWAQIQAFMRSIKPGSELLDWCCGKGHLLRSLCHCKNCRGEGLEWQAPLANDGNALARKWQLDCHIHNGDALHEDTAGLLKANSHVIALHACGDLHTHLLDLIAQHKVAAISLAPCCYHLSKHSHYVWRSKTLQHLPWQADIHTLRLCVEESVTAPRQQLIAQAQLQAWRLGFNALYEAQTGTPPPQPEPRLNMTIIKQGFVDFCHTRAQDSGITLPANLNFDHWQAQGEALQHRVQRLELARHLARRAMEILINADKTHYLQDQGMRAGLYQFCARQLSPRNMLIQGTHT